MTPGVLAFASVSTTVLVVLWTLTAVAVHVAQ